MKQALSEPARRAYIPLMTLLSGLPLVSIALAVMISAFIRLVQTMQLRQRVSFGHTGVRELAELSGVTDPQDLQDVFGPPGMNRIWANVTLATIETKRRLAGMLMSDPRLHWYSIAAGLGAFVISHWIVQLLLMIAAIIQSGAWLSAMRLPK
ncbi:MAG: hypothetical protein NXH72_02345 [Hyphomonadaceae bacterium]|nr:hypothetical protein [Hyphomonadaceae bacterium]